jgi:hypothetical protein
MKQYSQLGVTSLKICELKTCIYFLDTFRADVTSILLLDFYLHFITFSSRKSFFASSSHLSLTVKTLLLPSRFLSKILLAALLYPFWSHTATNPGTPFQRPTPDRVTSSFCDHLIPRHAMKTYCELKYSSTILDLGTRLKWVVRFTPRPPYPRGKSIRYTLRR